MQNWRTRGIALVYAFVACSLVVAKPSFAETSATTLPVSMTITAGCQILAAPVGLGSLADLAPAETASATITVTCTDTTPYVIEFPAGADPETTTNRITGTSSATIAYHVFTTSGLAAKFRSTVGADAGHAAIQTVTTVTDADIVNVTVFY